jgi:hypothetical protein
MYGRGTGTVKDAIFSAFVCLIATLSVVLLLLMGFRLPTFDTKVAENILNFVSDENLSRITKKFMWCTTVCDVVLQDNGKLLICFDTVHNGDLSVCTNKQDSNSLTIINCRYIGINNVTSNFFIAMNNNKRGDRGTSGTT